MKALFWLITSTSNSISIRIIHNITKKWIKFIYIFRLCFYGFVQIQSLSVLSIIPGDCMRLIITVKNIQNHIKGLNCISYWTKIILFKIETESESNFTYKPNIGFSYTYIHRTIKSSLQPFLYLTWTSSFVELLRDIWNFSKMLDSTNIRIIYIHSYTYIFVYIRSFSSSSSSWKFSTTV